MEAVREPVMAIIEPDTNRGKDDPFFHAASVATDCGFVELLKMLSPTIQPNEGHV
jgi:hypothetical protein